MSHLLAKTLNPVNACFYYEILNVISYNCSQNVTLKYIARWFNLITDTEKHFDLSIEPLKKVLSDSDLNVTTELEVFNSAESWVKHDTTERIGFAEDLLKTVRLQLLSDAALRSLLKSKNCFSKRDCCKTLILDTMKSKENNGIRYTHNLYRYCSQESFDIIMSGSVDSYCKIDNQNIYSYNIYKFSEKSFTQTTYLKKIINLKNDGYFQTFSSVYLNGVIYILSKEVMYSYSIFSKQFSKPVKLPEEIGKFCACAFMGNIYILGGLTRFRGSRFVPMVCNPKTNSWRETSRMKESRIKSACAVFGGKIVMSGGSDFGLVSSKGSVEAYDPSSNLWDNMPNMREARCGHSSVAIRNKLFMVGGSQTGNFEVFDTVGQMFVQIISPSPFVNSNFTTFECATIGNKIIVFDELYRKKAVFDVENERWSEAQDYKIKNVLFNCSVLKVPEI